MKTILVIQSGSGGRTRIVDDLFGMGFEHVRGEGFGTFLQVAQFVNVRHPIPIVLLYPGDERETGGDNVLQALFFSRSAT